MHRFMVKFIREYMELYEKHMCTIMLCEITFSKLRTREETVVQETSRCDIRPSIQRQKV